MYTRFRLELAMGVRALEHCQANPADTPQFKEFVGSLTQAVTDGRAYASQFGSGIDTARASVAERKKVRGQVKHQLLDITRIGRSIAEEIPALQAYFRGFKTNASHAAMIALARGYAAKVAELQDRYTAFGFGPDALAAFSAAVDSFEQSVNRTHAARRSHIGARAEMALIAARIMTSVEGIDAVNQMRFRDDPEKLEAWNSAKNVAWHNGRKPKGGGDQAA